MNSFKCKASKHIGLVSGLLLFLSLTFAGAANAIKLEQTVPSLILPGITQQEPSTLLPQAIISNALRLRAVNLDFSVLTVVHDSLNTRADQAQTILIPFFDDAQLPVVINRIEPTFSGGLAYSGKVAGDANSIAVLVNNNGVVSMTVTAGNKSYAIYGSAQVGYIAAQLAAFNLPDHGSLTPPVIDAKPLSREDTGDIVQADLPEVARDSGASIDVLIAYTPKARDDIGGVAAINANIDAQVALTNTIYANSNVVQRIRLVYRGLVTHTENASSSIELGRLSNASDGVLDELPVLRNLYKADLVSLWGYYPDVCGIGYIMTPESSGFASNAYNIVNSPSCTAGNAYTFAHEMGHNMGLRHDNYMDSNTTNVTPEAGGAAVNIAYAHGYVDLTNRFRTVMSYNDQCYNMGFNCTRIPYFSNPAVFFNNSASYPSAVSATTGNAANSQEFQALNDTRETVANFRAELSTFSGPGIVVFLPSTTYTVSEGVGSISLRVARHVGSTGAISVNYITTNGTAAAGTDYSATSGTLTWADGDTSERTINVPILQNTTLEYTEYFSVSLSDATGGASIGGASGTNSTATVSITDDEPDNFPVGGNMPAGYITPGSSAGAWTVVSDQSYMGAQSLGSAKVLAAVQGVYVNSDLDYTGNFLSGLVSFAYRISSYPAYGQFEFSIDGVVVLTDAGGESGWLVTNQSITAGVHTLKWRFKNRLNFPCANVGPPSTPAPGGGNCADRAWIDSVMLPLVKSSPNDFNGDSKSDILLEHTDGSVFAWLMNGTSPSSGAYLLGAGSGWSVIDKKGDFNGDGKADLLIKHTDGSVIIWLMNGTTTTGAYLLSAGSGWSVNQVADFNGDSKSDILIKHTDGSVLVWLMNGTSPSSGAYLLGAGSGWSVIDVKGDFNGDGKTDLLIKHTDGSVIIWLMNGTTATGAYLLSAGGGWSVNQVADFNGDSKSDIVIKHTDGSVLVWLMNGTSPSSGAYLLGAGSGWSVLDDVKGDFNGDGKADLLIKHTDGSVIIWLMNGTTTTGAYLLSAGSGWSVNQVADFNGDSKSDILIKHTDGSVLVWLMNGTSPSSGAYLLGAGSGWSVIDAKGDFNGDGKSDILIKHIDGSVQVWLMNGTTPNAAYLLGAGTGWSVLP